MVFSKKQVINNNLIFAKSILNIGKNGEILKSDRLFRFTNFCKPRHRCACLRETRQPVDCHHQ